MVKLLCGCSCRSGGSSPSSSSEEDEGKSSSASLGCLEKRKRASLAHRILELNRVVVNHQAGGTTTTTTSRGDQSWCRKSHEHRVLKGLQNLRCEHLTVILEAVMSASCPAFNPCGLACCPTPPSVSQGCCHDDHHRPEDRGHDVEERGPSRCPRMSLRFLIAKQLRWPDLRPDQGDGGDGGDFLKSLPSCADRRDPENAGKDCCNPFHLSRVVQQQQQQPLMFGGIGSQADTGGMDKVEEEPCPPYTSVEETVQGSVKTDKWNGPVEQTCWTLSPDTPRCPTSSLLMATLMPEEQDLMKESQKVWARLAYWENCQRVGPIHLVSKRFVRVVWTESCGCRSGGDHGCSMATNLMGGGAGATAAGKTPPGPAEDDSAGEVWCLSTLFEGPSHLSLRSDDGDPGLHPTLKTRLKIGRGIILSNESLLNAGEDDQDQHDERGINGDDTRRSGGTPLFSKNEWPRKCHVRNERYQPFDSGGTPPRPDSSSSVWLYNQSDYPVFVASPSLELTWPVMVHRIPPDHCMKVFDSGHWEAAEGMQKLLQRRLETSGPLDLKTVQISFGKGWGRNYSRQDVTCCPCWMELRLAASSFKGMDDVLSDDITQNVDSIVSGSSHKGLCSKYKVGSGK